jgi:hypothetical protein
MGSVNVKVSTKHRHSIVVIAAVLMIAGCSSGTHVPGPSGNGQQPLAAALVPRSVASVSPSSVAAAYRKAAGNTPPATDDVCATNPSGWLCVVQGGSLTGGGFYYPSVVQGQTVTCGTANPITGITITTSPTTTTTPPFTCLNTITATTSATITNNDAFTINASVNGMCSTNYCGPLPTPGYLEVECSLTAADCPLAQVVDNSVTPANPISGSPPPVMRP